jgi:dihydropyrimidinase
MYPKKGVIAVGSDADIVIYNPDATRTISAATHHMDVDYSCYEGREVKGKSEIVMVRGKVIVEGDKFLGREGDGRFLRRSPAEYARRQL